MRAAYLLIVLFLVFSGCATNTQNIDKELKQAQISQKILSKYQISQNSLVKLNGHYYFYQPTDNGITIYKLDKNYNIQQAKTINKLIDVTKIKAKNYIFILGNDQEKNRPVIIKLDTNLNIKSIKYIGNKYDLPKDIIFNKNPIVLLIHYNNGSFIEICKNDKCKIFKSKFNILPKFIKKFNGGYIITGSIENPQENLFVLFIKNDKIIWSKVYDFGMSDSPQKITIKNNHIIINVISQDYMGAAKYLTIVLDKNGNIINKKKTLEFQQLPVRFRT